MIATATATTARPQSARGSFECIHTPETAAAPVRSVPADDAVVLRMQPMRTRPSFLTALLRALAAFGA